MLIYGKNTVLYYLRHYPRDLINLHISNSVNTEKYDFRMVKKPVVNYVDKSFFEKNFPGRNHQGFAADVAEFQYFDFDSFSISEDSTILILDGIQDPANLGAILRTSEALGVEVVIIPKDRATAVTSAVIRASSGAARGVKVCRVVNIARTIDALKDMGVWVAAVDMDDNSESLFTFDLSGPVAFILGGEGRGIRRLTREKSDMTVTIPMSGKVDSLNVSVSAAIVLYQAVSKRRKK